MKCVLIAVWEALKLIFKRRNGISGSSVHPILFFLLFSCFLQGCVDHPIVLTEAVCNPLYSRQMMSELLFECYQVPKVSYGVDSLYSFYHNRRQNWPCSGLVISSGYQCTHILPVLEGRWVLHVPSNQKVLLVSGKSTHSSGIQPYKLLQYKFLLGPNLYWRGNTGSRFSEI